MVKTTILRNFSKKVENDLSGLKARQTQDARHKTKAKPESPQGTTDLIR